MSINFLKQYLLIDVVETFDTKLFWDNVSYHYPEIASIILKDISGNPLIRVLPKINTNSFEIEVSSIPFDIHSINAIYFAFKEILSTNFIGIRCMESSDKKIKIYPL